MLEIHQVLKRIENLWYIAGIKVLGEIIETQYLDFSMKKAMPLLTLPLFLSCLVAFHDLYTTKLK